MWKKSQWRFNDGQLSVCDHDMPEEKTHTIWIHPEIRPKRGKGFEMVDEYSDKLADDLVDFLNRRDGYIK